MAEQSSSEGPWWWISGEDGSGEMVPWLQMAAEDCRRLLEDLRDAVPTRTVHDGGQEAEVFLMPSEISEPHLKAAAEVLALGELEAASSGHDSPPSEMEQWASLVTKIEAVLRDAKENGKTRRNLVSLDQHLSEARDRLKALRFTEGFARYEAKDPTERAFVQSILSEGAIHAFHLGWRMRAIDQKPFDDAAYTGKKVRAGARLGGEMTKAPRARTTEILSAMAAKIEDQVAKGETRNVTTAARYVFERQRLGTGIDANRRLWHRHHSSEKK